MSSTAWWTAGFVLIAWAGQCVLGAYVAGTKRRSRVAGFLTGLFLGVVGVLMLVLMPARPEKKTRRPTVDHYGWKPMDETEETVGDWITQPQP